MATQDNAAGSMKAIAQAPLDRVQFDDLPLDYIIDLLAAEQATFAPDRPTEPYPTNPDRQAAGRRL